MKILKPAPSSRGEIRPVTQFPKKFKNQPNFALLGGVIFDINHPKKPMFVVWSWTSKTFIMPFIQLIGTQPPLLLYLLVIRHKNPPESGRWQMSRQEITGKKNIMLERFINYRDVLGGTVFQILPGLQYLCVGIFAKFRGWTWSLKSLISHCFMDGVSCLEKP